MSKRVWKNLDPSKTYTLSLGNGWTATLVSGTQVTLQHSSVGAAAKSEANADAMTIDPDPGSGRP